MSYARVTSGAQLHAPPPIFPPGYSPTGFAQAFTAYIMYESLVPGGFNRLMDGFCIDGWTKIKHPKMPTDIMAALNRDDPIYPPRTVIETTHFNILLIYRNNEFQWFMMYK